MKNLINDNKGQASGIVTITLFLIIAGAVYLIMLIPTNLLYGTANGMIANGDVPQRAKDALDFHKKMTIVIPLIIVIVGVLWGWIKSLEHRSIEGT